MSKAVIQPFEEYQKSRIMFVQTVAELANREQNIDSLKRLGVMKLLGPLLADPVTSIKQSAALAIGRLARQDVELASSIIQEDKGKILSQLLESLETNNKFYKKAACYVISSVAKHNKELAQKVVEGGSIKFLVACLEEYDPSVKETAAWALMNIAEKSKELAMEIEKAKAIDSLISCLQEPEITIKRVAIKTLSYIAGHSDYLANQVANDSNLNIILYYLVLKDTALKRQILLCLGNLAKNSKEVAGRIINGINDGLLSECIKGKDINCQKNALVLVNEIAKKTQEHAQILSTKIKTEVFVNYIFENSGEQRLCGIPILTTLASYNKDHASNIISLRGHEALAISLYTESDQKVISAACVAIANLSKYSAELTNEMSKNLVIGRDNFQRVYNIPYKLLEYSVFKKDNWDDFKKDEDRKLAIENYHEIKETAKYALDNIIDYTSNIDTVLPLLEEPPFSNIDKSLYESILVRVVRKIRDLLNDNKIYKRDFFKNKSLKKIIDLKKTYKSIKDELVAFNEFYPPEIINFFSEDYEKELLRRNHLD
jgi:hypothetical protein